MQSSLQTSNYNHTITGLRGFLAISVVLYHVYTGSVDDHILSKDYLPAIGPTLGPLAVNLFFVISGYLITLSLIRHKKIRNFVIDRVLRIYPVFFIIHLLIFIAGPMIHYSWFDNITVQEYILNFFSNLFLLPGVFDLPIAQIVAWSLSFEAAFYIVISMYYFIFTKRGKWTILVPLPLTISLYLVYEHPAFWFFVAGILLSISNVSSRIPVLTKFDGLVFLVLAYICYDPSFIYWSLLFSFFFFNTLVKQVGVVSNILSATLFQYLGKISYSLYLWHTFVMFPIKRIVLKLQLPNEWLALAVFGIVSIILSVIISNYSYKLVEYKFTSWVKRKLKKPVVPSSLQTNNIEQFS